MLDNSLLTDATPPPNPLCILPSLSAMHLADVNVISCQGSHSPCLLLLFLHEYKRPDGVEMSRKSPFFMVFLMKVLSEISCRALI